MNYPGTQYTFSPEHGVNMGPQEPIHYSAHTSLPQHIGNYFPAHLHTHFADFERQASTTEDYDDGGGETSTRPRLTKDQVDVLESQFQAQPKPNSNVKRHLAVQTKLTLPRVANWFQNRRAKAKQQKKQEEFERKRAMGMVDGWKSDSNLPSAYTIQRHLNTPEASARAEESQTQTTPPSAHAASGRNSGQDASWASLQRALSAATAAQNQRALEQEREQSFTSMPPPQIPPSDQAVDHRTTSYPEWTPKATSSVWPLSQPDESLAFDFGFAQADYPNSSDASQSQDSPVATSAPGFAIPPDVWPGNGHMPAAPTHPTLQPVDRAQTTFTSPPPIDVNQSITFPPAQADTTFQLPQYPASRRGSASDELTSNFGNFAVSTPPMPSPLRTASTLESFKRIEGEVDLAGRRKRPRPAPLGSAALRSRSHGAPPSMSPTLRLGSHSPHPYPVRHVKSMGQNLNVRYSGIRKPSSAQRSPLNVATFAEADAFSELLQSRQITADGNVGTTPPTPLSSDDLGTHQIHLGDDGLYAEQGQHLPDQLHSNGQAVNFNMASPPSTPFKPEFYPAYLQTMPPLSAPPQYAMFTDHTPPYSAGPLTGGSWQDAPFPLAELSYQMPQVVYPTAQDFGNNGAFQNFSTPAQAKADGTYPSKTDQKETEFCIQEFPRQKEEHAHAAQQLAQPKPKNYVFANATPNDF